MIDRPTDRFGDRIYLDYQSSCPIDERVIEAMVECYRSSYGNPSSTSHSIGRQARDVLEESRARIADAVGCDSRDVVLTSGATEANNLALLGVASAATQAGRFITSASEHKAVLDPVRRTRRLGHTSTILGVDSVGHADLSQLEDTLPDAALMVSCMAVNNELGTVGQISEIAAICHAADVPLHCDAAQVFHHQNAEELLRDCDLFSLSAHKLYGPQGIGALIVRRESEFRPRLAPLLEGGGQEQRLRSGTVPVALAAGFAEACDLARQNAPTEQSRLKELRDKCWRSISSRLSDVILNGPELNSPRRVTNNLNVSFAGVDGEKLLSQLSSIAVSSGSACSTTDPKPSHVLKAIGRSDRMSRASLRVSVGRWTTQEQVQEASDAIVSVVKSLRVS